MACGPPYYDNYQPFTKDESLKCKSMMFSKDGSLFAWSNGLTVKVISMPSCTLVQEIIKPHAAGLLISTCNSILVIYEPYMGSKTDPEVNPNLSLWNLKTGKCFKGFIHKRQMDWGPQWSDDESVCGMLVNTELLFYEKNNFDSVAKTMHIQKVAHYSISGTLNPHIIVYVAGNKGQPSYVRLYKYPNIEGTGKALANKSFFKADRVSFNWNKKGLAVLVMTITDVDTTGTSYYGEQMLHCISTNGESCIVSLNSTGPINCAEWNPNSLEFCVIYGLMPSKATLFNLKCDPIFDFGSGHKNVVHFSPFGNIMTLGGFGNLQGGVEFWDTVKRKKISTLAAPDTTYFEWCPDGEHVLTATTSPRLRVSNGYKIWHYSGSLMHQFRLEKGELYDIIWQPVPLGKYTLKPIVNTPVPGIEISKAEAKPAVYRPPGARGKPSSFNLHDDVESHVGPKRSLDEIVNQTGTKSRSKKVPKAAPQKNGSAKHIPGLPPGATPLPSMTDQEKYKKSRNIMKKLDQIKKLKQHQQEGKTLDKNELDKVQKEAELIKELEGLKI